MRTLSRWIWVGSAALVVLAACSGRSSRAVLADHPRSNKPEMQIAVGCPEPSAAPVDFTFAPRSHAPRSFARRNAPRLESLPPMVENAGCTPAGHAMEGRGRPAPPVTVGTRTPRPKRGPIAVAPAAKKAAPAHASAAAPPAPAAGAEMEKSSSPSPVADRKSADTAAPSEAPPAPQGEAIATAPFTAPEPCPPAPPPEAPDATDAYSDWGVSTYLSNDDSMSLSSAQRILFAIDGFLPLPAQHLRRHELLNYFSFDTNPVAAGDDFSVLAGLAPKPGEAGVYTLALAVQGRSVDRGSRRNLALTVLVDRSGSMKDDGKLAFLKQGLHRMSEELAPGDIVNLVTFNTAACVPLQNFVVGRDNPETLQRAIDRIRPQGNTDLGTGLLRAYRLADASYRPDYNNRVVLVTDALTNTGETDPELLSTVSRFYDSRQIRLSGIGVGKEFDDRLLDRLTERGKGAYVFLGSKAEVDAVFGARFVSLVETTALDTHFLLHLPPSLRMNVFYGEQASTSREEVQPIHYFAGTSQLFLADVMARKGQLRDGDMIMLGIEYQDPESGQSLVEERAFRLGDVPREPKNVQKARLVVEFVDALQWMSGRVPQGGKARSAPHGWVDDAAWSKCAEEQRKLTELARGVGDDPEVRRIVGLWSRYCERFEAPRTPAEHERRGWPGAGGG